MTSPTVRLLRPRCTGLVSPPRPAPAWARMTHSLCSAGWVGSESRPNMELFVLSEARGHEGGAGLSQGERVPRRLRAHSPPSPVMGTRCPVSSRLRLPDFLSPPGPNFVSSEPLPVPAAPKGFGS